MLRGLSNRLSPRQAQRIRRDWVLHVSDDLGEEIFVLPFEFLLGKPH